MNIDLLRLFFWNKLDFFFSLYHCDSQLYIALKSEMYNCN